MPFPSTPGAGRPGALTPGLPAPAYQAIKVVNSWQASRAATAIVSASAQAPAPPWASLACPVTPAGGHNWLIAMCSWSFANSAYLGATVSVADDARNMWWPLGAPKGTSSSAGHTRCSIWACPNPRHTPGTVFVAPTAAQMPVFPAAVAVTVIEVAGLSDYLGTPAVVTAHGNASYLASAGAGTPTGEALVLSVGASDAGVLPGPGDVFDFEDGTDGWAGSYASVARSSAWSRTGSYSLAVTSDGTGTTFWQGYSGSQPKPCSPGDTVTAQAWVYSLTALTVSISLGWNSASGYMSSTGGTAVPLTPGVPALVTVTGVAPANAVSASIAVAAQGASPAGTQFFVDTVLAVYPALWTPLAGVDLTGQAVLHTAPGWAVTSAAKAAAWAPGAAGNLSACTATILVSNPAPPQAAADWPYPRLQAGFGAGANTPPDEITWTDLTNRFLAGKTASASKGKQYQLGQTQAGSVTVGLDNNDAALTPDNDLSPYFPGVTLDTPLRLLMDWQGHTYPLWSGPVEEWPQAWSPTTRYGYAQAKVTDSWSLLNDSLNAVLQQEIEEDQPAYYWTCGDDATTGAPPPSGSTTSPQNTQAQNSAPGNTTALQVVVSKSGALGQTFGFGASSGALPGDPSGTVYSQTGLSSGGKGYGYCLMCSDPNLPSLAGDGLTIMGWFEAVDGAQPNTDLILFRFVNAALGPAFGVNLSNPSSANVAEVMVVTWDASTRASTSTYVDSGNWLTAGWFHVAMTVTQTAWTVYVNGAAAGSGTCNLPSSAQWVTFMGEHDRFNTLGEMNGSCAHLAIFPQQLPAGRIASIFLAGCPTPLVTPGSPAVDTTIAAAQFAGETAPQRIERLAGYGQWTGPRAISQNTPLALAPITDIQSGSSAKAANGVVAAVDGKKAGQAISDLVLTDGGFCYTDGAGVLRYVSRDDLYGQSPQWTLGEQGADTLNQNPDFAGGSLAGWSRVNCSIEPSQAEIYLYPWSMLITPAGPPNTFCDVLSSEFALVPGAQYTVSAWVQSPAGWPKVVIGCDWHDSSHSYVSSSTQTFSVAPASWTFFRATVTAPTSGAAFGVARIGLGGTPTTDDQLWVQHARLTPGSPEIPYLIGVQLGLDKARYYSQAELTQSAGAGVAVVSQDSAAVTAHGASLFTATTYQQNLADVADMANWITGTRAAPQNRARKITVDAGKNPDLIEFVLDVAPAVPLVINRRPVTAEAETSITAQTAQVTHRIDYKSRTLAVDLVTDLFPEGDALIIGDPVRGQLTGANLLAC